MEDRRIGGQKVLRIAKNTYIRSKVLGFPEERIEDLPGGHDDNIHGEEYTNHQEQLGVLHHLKHHQYLLFKILKIFFILNMFSLKEIYKVVLSNLLLLKNCQAQFSRVLLS